MDSACEAPEYAAHVERLRAADPGLAAELAGCAGVEHVLVWMPQRGLGRAAVDIIGQDEFNYDFLIELEAGGRWLAFGVF